MLDITAAVGAVVGKVPGAATLGLGSRKPLQGRVAAVTGGAAGIGRATAAALVEQGAVVVIGDVDGAGAQRAAHEVGAAMAQRLDVTDRAGFTTFLDTVEAVHGPLDILINNAGVMPLGRLVDEDDATTERILQVNLHAVIHGTREAMHRMVPRGNGHVVNLASTLGKAGLPGGATYCATKFAVVGFSESVKAELAGTGVDLTLVLPGIVQTSLGEGVQQPLMIRRVQPEEVAAAIVDALERPRYEVYVPFEAGPVAMLGAALPSGLRDRVARGLGLHATLADADAELRAAYESRVRASRAG